MLKKLDLFTFTFLAFPFLIKSYTQTCKILFIQVAKPP